MLWRRRRMGMRRRMFVEGVEKGLLRRRRMMFA